MPDYVRAATTTCSIHTILKTEVIVFFATASFGLAVLNKASIQSVTTWFCLQQVLKCKTFYSCLELSIFCHQVTEFGLIDHGELTA